MTIQGLSCFFCTNSHNTENEKSRISGKLTAKERAPNGQKTIPGP
jgi:hypothetical protein